MSDPLPISAGREPAATPAAVVTGTVLLVTTDAALRERVRALLVRAGLNCPAAASVSGALERFRGGEVDLILVECASDGETSRLLLKEQGPDGEPVPCMGLIRPGEQGFGLELIRAGALDCVIDDGQLPERLVPLVGRALQRLAQQRQRAAAHEALRQSEARHRASFELASVGMLETDPQSGRLLRVNAAFCALVGYTDGELTAKRFSELLHPEERDAGWQAFQCAVRGDTRDYRGEKRCLRKDGTVMWIRLNAFIIRDAEGRAVRTVGMAEDITDRKQAEEALRASEARYRALVHATSAAVWRLTPDGERQLSLEGGIVRGHREPESRPGVWLELIHPEDRDRTREAWRRAVAAQSLYEIEHRVLAADGSYRHVLARGGPVRNAAGEVIEWIGASVDITARTRAEAALRESEERYRRISESGFINISFFTSDGRVVDANNAFLRLMGFSRQELAAGLVRWDRLTAPEWGERTRQAIAEFEATGHVRPYEKEYLRRDGTRFWGLVGAARLEGRAEGVAFVVDITERKRAEQALREREAQLAFAQRVGRIGVWGRNLVNQASFVTEEWCDIVGVRSPASVRTLADFLARIHPEDRARVEAANRQVLETGAISTDLEFRVLHPERGVRWMLARARRLQSPDHKGDRLLGVIIDITERKRTEEALRLSEERLRFSAQAAGFGNYDLNLVTGQAYRSPEYKALFGVSLDGEFPLDADRTPSAVHPDDRALVRKAVMESRDPAGLGIKDVEYRVLLPDDTVRWLLVRGRTFFEGEGAARRPVRSLGIALDVTERKQLEQEILEISGREQRRIGHDLHDDLCQRLGGIQLLSGVLEKELAAEGHPQAPQAGRILHQVREALERARLLARGLAPVAVEQGGLASALQGLADNAAQLFRIRCEFRGEPVGLADDGAAMHLYRIAQEAITNAVKHGWAQRVVIRLVDGGDCFELKVSDDGRGFDQVRGAPAGMGLRIMKYRAAILGATLEVRSVPGQGTTVTCAFGKGLCSAKCAVRPRTGAKPGEEAK